MVHQSIEKNKKRKLFKFYVHFRSAKNVILHYSSQTLLRNLYQIFLLVESSDESASGVYRRPYVYPIACYVFVKFYCYRCKKHEIAA